MNPHHQRELPLAEAEGSHAERRNRLGLALLRVDADVYLSRLVEQIFEATAGGSAGDWRASYERIRSRPWGLCCSRSKARATVARAWRLGLVTIEETVTARDGQAANAYRIDWAGVAAILLGESHPAGGVSREQGGASTRHPPVSTEHGGASTRHPPVFSRHPYAGACATDSGTVTEIPEPVPVPVPEGRGGQQARAELAARIAAEVPELQDAAGRAVHPLPAGRLAGTSVFKPLTIAHLQHAEAITKWFRCQLAAAAPVCDPSEADLLLVLAARIHATRVSAKRVLNNRVALWVSVVKRRNWMDSLEHVPEARAELDALLVTHGDDLLRGPWPVQRAEPAPLTAHHSPTHEEPR